jgi:LmbE family N-acetylglucosaminyl deacetylase
MLAAGGLMQRAIEHGGTVHVMVVTSGDGFPEGVETLRKIRYPKPSDFRNYGKLREAETVAGLAAIGVPRRNITFLGFPDAGVCLIASQYLRARVAAFESPFTEREQPPRDEQVIRGTAYRGTDLRAELERIMIQFAPTLVVAPHPEDSHPDHCATNIFVRDALRAIAPAHIRPPRTLLYLVHYRDWPPSGLSRTTDLRPPAGFPRDEGRWLTLALTPDETARKKAALALYTTQVQAIGDFLTAMARPNELFIEGDVKEPECWCDAEHVATALAPRWQRKPRPPRRP